MKRKCQRCQDRATLHITEIFDEGFEEIDLCHKCAHKYLHDTDEEGASETGTAMAGLPEKPGSTLQCPICKTTYADFRSTGRLGCPHDYEVFREELHQLLETIHGGLRHIGKVPRRLPADTRMQTELIKLRQELQQAVAVEDYEKAAQLRDQIGTLEKQA